MGGIAIVSAPSNLGLRPPRPTSVPGCAKAPEALRQAGLYATLLDHGAVDAGTVIAPRYVDDAVPGRLRNHDAILDYSRRLSGRLTDLVSVGTAPLVIGGDCSLVIAAGHALKQRGRYGLVHLDGHTDFRHPGNSTSCASLAGEDLAASIGLHWPAVSNIDGLGPYFRPADTAHIGCRDDDAFQDEAGPLLGQLVPASTLHRDGVRPTVESVLDLMTGTDGFWLHLDVDILDPQHMPAVDSPAAGGIDPTQLFELLSGLAPHAVGAEVAIFDPDLDPEGRYATLLASVLADGLSALGSAG